MITEALIETGVYCIKTIPVIIAGIVLINIIEQLGWISKLAWLAKPVTKLGRLHDGCGVSFITAFGSPSAANAMLMNLYTNGTIRKKELFIAVMTNSFPVIMMHWRSMLPVMIPLMGLIGVYYFGILVWIGFIKTFLVLIAGRIMLKNTLKRGIVHLEKDKERPGGIQLLKSSLIKSWPLIRRILFITVPTTLIVFILVEYGVFDIV
ncbi:MAG: nucleoside recognition protein, partial [Bacteroidetes bacterium]|nr:nucleoside recognition protein [Bacteroidota bacterium]